MSEAVQDVVLWGAKSIAREICVSESVARALAKRPDTPIYKPPGSNRLCAFRDELRRWMRTKAQ
jgi:hypothetical protein